MTSQQAEAARHSDFRFRCAHCDKIHVGLPDVCFPTPDVVNDISETEFNNTCLINQDICIVGGHCYYIYCSLEVPVIGYPDCFAWGVWCKTSWTPFKLYWDDSAGLQPPTQAVLSNDLTQMDPSSGLDCELIFRDDDFRPLAVLASCEHKLYRIQQHGLTVEQAVAQAQSVGTLLLVA